MSRYLVAVALVIAACGGVEEQRPLGGEEPEQPQAGQPEQPAQPQPEQPAEPDQPAELGQPAPTISYARDIQPIWDRHCNRCHNFHTPHLTAPGSRQNLDAASWRTCTNDEHAPFIVPGHPEQSFLYYKITGTFAAPIIARGCDRLMPADQNGRDIPLIEVDPDAVERIRTWIAEGALDN
jgi:hypothetical protein